MTVATPALIARTVREFATRMRWTLSVPGTHDSGLPYDDLLDILAAQGRDFRDDNRSLRAHVALALGVKFEGRKRLPTLTELRSDAADAIIEWVVGRMDQRVRDIRVKANAFAYAKWKHDAGKDTRPGQQTGELREAIADEGKVSIT